VTAVSITVADLTPFSPNIDETKAQAMIDDALALAARVAPCINDAAFAYPEAARAIIRGAILRWDEAGSGAAVQQQAGPFGQTIDTRQQRRGMFWPSEINDLAALCSTSSTSYTTSLAGPDAGTGYWSAPNVWTPL
jgi:hypothetical protein